MVLWRANGTDVYEVGPDRMTILPPHDHFVFFYVGSLPSTPPKYDGLSETDRKEKDDLIVPEMASLSRSVRTWR